MTAHILGFPRIGAKREMKKAVESYWKGKISLAELKEHGKSIRKFMWQSQSSLDFVQVGDFGWYDHVLNLSALLGVIPERVSYDKTKNIDLDTIFKVARGRTPGDEQEVAASSMVKWFDTNYHYIVPEIKQDQEFKISSQFLFEEIEEAKQLGYKPKVFLVGPVTYLYLAKCVGGNFDKLTLLDKVVTAYNSILEKLAELNVEWVQLDEPICSLSISSEWQDALTKAYQNINNDKVKVLVTSYFGELRENLKTFMSLDVNGIHIDGVRGKKEIEEAVSSIASDKVLSLGVVEGRNIWKNDLSKSYEILKKAKDSLGDRLWVSSSCSLLHVPVDLNLEQKLDSNIKSWLAYAIQKIGEIKTLSDALENKDSVAAEFEKSDAVVADRKSSSLIHNDAVKQRMASVSAEMMERKSAYEERAKKQREKFNFPLFPTTTIGSFPQTQEIRKNRRQFKKGEISNEQYIEYLKKEIAYVVKEQESYGLDVLVHGEPERNDMVEYFGELMNGYAFSEYGWVQSYGSRCVKPPVIFGDISRPEAMTVEWSKYAQSVTSKKMKGMLTGPVTMLCWSFVRDDVSRKEVCYQLGLAIRDEVVDLEKAGIDVIQIDEAAMREGLPLRKEDWSDYLQWAIDSFRITASGVEDGTQIHTHMCYSEFNDIIESIARMDADVITIETSRGNMKLLDIFEEFEYPNEIGPGVYDIHSPVVPTKKFMYDLMVKAMDRIPKERLWVNPDCGLKTRGWTETKEAMIEMVDTAKELRKNFA